MPPLFFLFRSVSLGILLVEGAGQCDIGFGMKAMVLNYARPGRSKVPMADPAAACGRGDDGALVQTLGRTKPNGAKSRWSKRTES